MVDDCCVTFQGFRYRSTVSWSLVLNLRHFQNQRSWHYISGYVVFLENISITATELDTNESEYLEEVTKGRLGQPHYLTTIIQLL